MYICYIDESGTSDVPGNTSHFVLAGVSIPIWHWRDADREITQVLARYDLGDAELHTAWILRPYIEQRRIPNFSNLDYVSRRAAVERERNAHLLQLQQQGRRTRGTYNQARKNYAHTKAYVHLSHAERLSLVREVADCVGSWGYARLFAECIDKLHFDPIRSPRSIDEQAFEQVVTRFDRYLVNIGNIGQPLYGLLVHDNNQTIARKHTQLMRDFHKRGTLWGQIQRIIETPLFVDSSLTSLVQMADLCSYALRRFVENGETDLFRRLFIRADRTGQRVVGVRHYAPMTCSCEICVAHRI